MNILLDTHILLWALSNDERLSEKARKLIENEKNKIFYSIISLWEVEIKLLKHPDVMSLSAKELAKYCAQSGFQRVLVKENHIFAMEDLKREKNASPHKDPFDRMLICQASTENMLFLTHDFLISGYSNLCILIV